MEAFLHLNPLFPLNSERKIKYAFRKCANDSVLELSFAEEKGFNGTIFQCVDRAVDFIGGDVKQSFYYQISLKYELQIEQFATRPTEVYWASG